MNDRGQGEARRLLELAAAQGHARAVESLAGLDVVRARRRLERAAKRGDSWALNNLAIMHAQGQGRPKSVTRSCAARELLSTGMCSRSGPRVWVGGSSDTAEVARSCATFVC